MTEQRLTPWFPGTVKPVHVGPYERKMHMAIYMDYWDGENWTYNSDWGQGSICVFQDELPWRGIAK